MPEDQPDKLEVASRRLTILDALAPVYIEQSSFGVIIAERGQIVYANHRAQNLLGYHHSELEGQPLEIVVPEGQKEAHRKHVQGYAQDPRPRAMGMSGMSLAAAKKDGTTVPVEIELLTHTIPEGTFTIATIRIRAGT